MFHELVTGCNGVNGIAGKAFAHLAVRAGQPGGRLELRQGAPDGPLMATLEVPDTGWKWKERKVAVQVTGEGKETIYLVGAKAPFSVKSFRFNQ